MGWLSKSGGELLSYRRQYLNYSVSEMANFLNVARKRISAIEGGELEINEAELDKLCQLLIISRDVVLGKGEKPVDPNVGALLRDKGGISEVDVNELENFISFLSQAETES